MPSRLNTCFLCQDLGISGFLPAYCDSLVLLAGVPIELPPLSMEPGKGALESSDLGRCGVLPRPQTPLPAWARLIQTCVQSEDLSCPSLAPALIFTYKSLNSLQPHCMQALDTHKDNSGPVPRALPPKGQTNCSVCKLDKTGRPDLRPYSPLLYPLP